MREEKAVVLVVEEGHVVAGQEEAGFDACLGGVVNLHCTTVCSVGKGKEEESGVQWSLNSFNRVAYFSAWSTTAMREAGIHPSAASAGFEALPRLAFCWAASLSAG